MSSRILRVPDGQPFRTETQGVVRIRPHDCGRNCPRHDTPVPVAPKCAKKGKKGKRAVGSFWDD